MSFSRSVVHPSLPTPLRRTVRFGAGVVVVDSATAGLAMALVEFDSIGTIPLKGKSCPVEVYTPLRPAAASVRDDALSEAKE